MAAAFPTNGRFKMVGVVPKRCGGNNNNSNDSGTNNRGLHRGLGLVTQAFFGCVRHVGCIGSRAGELVLTAPNRNFLAN